MKKLLLLSFFVSAMCLNAQTKKAFLGAEADVASLVDDDAKAAAEWMQATYGADFKYIQFSNISASELSDVKVAMIYYLTPSEDLGFSATASNVSTLLPSELQAGTPQTNTLTAWVKSGGDMLIAGEATPFIFSLGRVPADFTQPRAAGNYVYSEFGCAGSTGCIDMNKPPEDHWGLGMRDNNNSGDRRSHPFFNGLTFEDNGDGPYLALQNSATREVRLVWWQHFDGILNPSCCGSDAALLFEQTFSATKFGTLRNITDAFGYGAVLWNRTDETNDPNFDSQIPTDFQGSIMSIENTIVGYEWNSNSNDNAFQSNIETFTQNIIGYLESLNNDTLGVEEFDAQTITIYPNPVENELYIAKGNADDLLVSVYDINGRLLLKNIVVNNNPIDVSNISNGLLFAEIKDKNGNTLKTLKVIKK